MHVNPDIQKRIFDAAAQLHSDAGHGDFPTVDAVRRLTRTNMNDTAIVMKLWRAMQATAASPAPASISDNVQRIHNDGLAALWHAANEHAGTNLRTAQAGWEVERAEGETVLAQLAASFDAQARELEKEQHTLEKCRKCLDESRHTAADAQACLDGCTAENRALHSRMEAADILIAKLHGHIAELRKDLEQSNAQAAHLQEQCDNAKQSAHEEALDLKTMLATRDANLASAGEQLTHARQERGAALQTAADARDGIAELRGKIEALKNQNAELLKLLSGKEG
jgi:colicin import membrane protein